MDQLPWDDEPVTERDGYFPGLNSSENDAALKKGYVDLGLVNLKNVQDETKFGQVVGGKVAQAMRMTGKDTAFIRDPYSIVGTKGITTPQIMDAVRRYFRDEWMEESFLEAEREMDRPGTRAAVLSTAADQVMSCRVDISRVQGKTGAGYKVTLVPGPKETLANAEKMVDRKTAAWKSRKEAVMGPFGRTVRGLHEELAEIVGDRRAGRIEEHLGVVSPAPRRVPMSERVEAIKKRLQERKGIGTVTVTWPKGTTGLDISTGKVKEPESITHYHPVTGKKTVYPKGKGWKMVFGDWRQVEKVKEELASFFGDVVAEAIIEEIMRQAGMAAWDLTEGKEFVDVEKDLNGLKPDHPGWLPQYMENILTLVDKRFREDPRLKVVFIKDPEHRLADPKNSGSMKRALDWMMNDLRLWVSGMGRGTTLQPWMQTIVQASDIQGETHPQVKGDAINLFLDGMEDAFKSRKIAGKIEPVTGTTAEGWKVTLSKSPMEFGVALANSVHKRAKADYAKAMERFRKKQPDVNPYAQDYEDHGSEEPHDVDLYADEMAAAAEAQRHHAKGWPS